MTQPTTIGRGGWRLRPVPQDLADRYRAEGCAGPRYTSLVVVAAAGKFVEELRLEEARRMLESGSESVERVAALAGFGSIDSLQRHFSEIYATTPSEYRSRFQTALRR